MKNLITIPLSFLLTGCTSIIMLAYCNSLETERSMEGITIQLTAVFETKNGPLTLVDTMECKPIGYGCSGIGWVPIFKDKPANFDIKLSDEKKIRLPFPSCYGEYDVGTKYPSNVRTISSSELIANQDSSFLPLSDLEKKSALELFGVRLKSYQTLRVVSE